jgi:hypothetical protein
MKKLIPLVFFVLTATTAVGDQQARSSSLNLPGLISMASMSMHYKKYSNKTTSSCPASFVAFADDWWEFHTPNIMSLKDGVDPEKYFEEVERSLAKSRKRVNRYCSLTMIKKDMKRLKEEFPDDDYYRKPLEALFFGNSAIYEKEVPDY